MHSVLRRGKQMFGRILDPIALPYYHVAPPERCENLGSIAARCGGSLKLEASDRRVDYALPANASPEVRDFLRPYTSMEFPQEFIGHLPGGRLFGPGVVISPDGKSVARDVSVDFGQPGHAHWLLNHSRIRRARQLPGTTLGVATMAGDTYYHWLFDELPRLLTARDVPFETIVGDFDTPFSRDALALLGCRGRPITPLPGSHFECEQLVVPSLVGMTGHPSRKVAELLSRFAEPLYGGSSPFGERIYLSREKAVRRKITNEAELWSHLEPLGFRKVILEDIPWKEQVNTFYHAKEIVAPHGAGLANLVFCQTGTRVVEFFDRGYMHWVFWQLASIRGLDYRPIVPATGDALIHSFERNEADLTVDAGQMKQMMAALRL